MSREHAAVRAQQRGIPPLIIEWLDEFGEEIYDGHGGVRRYFSKRSIRAMERALGRAIVRRLADYLGVYKVDSSSSGHHLTIGHLTRRIKRP
jgi:hypothetical protein